MNALDGFKIDLLRIGFLPAVWPSSSTNSSAKWTDFLFADLDSPSSIFLPNGRNKSKQQFLLNQIK